MISFLIGIAPIVPQCQQQARAQGFVVLQTQATEPPTLKTWRRGQTQTLTCTVNANHTVVLSNPDFAVTDRLWQLHGETNPPITLEFRDGRISGSGGCNRYMGSYTLTDRTLQIQGLASTKRACPPPILERETRFLTTLSQVQGFRVQGDDLLLDTGKEPLRFHGPKP